MSFRPRGQEWPGDSCHFPVSAVFEEPEDPSNRSFFSEIISSVSDVKFSHSGRYMLTRDYLTVKVWDLNMEARPIETYQVGCGWDSLGAPLWVGDPPTPFPVLRTPAGAFICPFCGQRHRGPGNQADVARPRAGWGAAAPPCREGAVSVPCVLVPAWRQGCVSAQSGAQGTKMSLRRGPIGGYR